MKRILVGISGASGSIYGIRLLEILQQGDIETHLIISEGAKTILEHETNKSIESVVSLASYVYDNADMGAGPASGSFRLDGMCIVPCSMKTLASIAHGFSSTLMSRAATCMLKENKRLVLAIRETPLELTGLTNMALARQTGAIILPAAPAFYHQPQTIDDLVNFIVGKILDQFGIAHALFERWKENI